MEPSNAYLPTIGSMTGLSGVRKPLLTLVIVALVAGALLSPRAYAYDIYYQVYTAVGHTATGNPHEPAGPPGGTTVVIANISAGSQYQIRVTQIAFSSSFQITATFSPALPVTVNQNGFSQIDVTLQIPGSVSIGEYNVSSTAQWDTYSSTGWTTQSPDCCVNFKLAVQQSSPSQTGGTNGGGSGTGGGGGTDLAQVLGYVAGAAILIIVVAFYLGRRRRTLQTMLPPPVPGVALPAAAAFCSNCGSQLSPGAPFCGQCGTPVQ